MDDNDRAQARGILQAIRRARAELSGPGPADKRAGRAGLCLSAYTREGILSPHVRDVYNARGVRALEAALDTLESLARSLAEPDDEPA